MKVAPYEVVALVFYYFCNR